MDTMFATVTGTPLKERARINSFCTHLKDKKQVARVDKFQTYIYMYR